MLLTESRNWSADRRLIQASLRDCAKNRRPLQESELFQDIATRCREGQIKLFEVDDKGTIRLGRDASEMGIGRLFTQFLIDDRGELLSESEADDFRLRMLDGTNNRVFQENAINTSMFSNIIGQISFSSVLAAYESPAFLMSQLVEVKKSKTQQREIVPGVTKFGRGSSKEVGEAQDYPRAILSESWVTVPRKRKFGFIAEATMEMVREDNTGLFLERLNSGTETMLFEMERECLGVVCGTETLYSRNGGPAQATYGDTHTQGDFDNLVASNALADPSDLQAVYNAFSNMTDPDTGNPIMMNKSVTLLVPTNLKPLADVIVNQMTTIKYGADSGAIQMIAPNAVARAYGSPNILSSALVDETVGGTPPSTWFAGDFKAAFKYAEVEPMRQQSLPPNHPEMFYRDVVTAVKVGRTGRTYVAEPRKAVKCTQ